MLPAVPVPLSLIVMLSFFLVPVIVSVVVVGLLGVSTMLIWGAGLAESRRRSSRLSSSRAPNCLLGRFPCRSWRFIII